MIKKLTLATLLTATALQADTIGGEISLGMYNHSPSGNASYTLPHTPLSTNIDLEDDFGWDDEQDIIIKAYFEHPVPLLPNIKIAYSSLGHSGKGIVEGFSWGGIIGLDGAIDTSLDLDMYDLTLYYELLDNAVEVDAGLTVRYFSGDLSVRTLVNLGSRFMSVSAGLSEESTDLSLWVPMLYGKVKFNIPNTDISLQAEANGISWQDTSFYDYEVGARYTLAMGLGLEAGYKAIHLDSKDLTDGLKIDVDSSGFYTSIIWDF